MQCYCLFITFLHLKVKIDLTCPRVTLQSPLGPQNTEVHSGSQAATLYCYCYGWTRTARSYLCVCGGGVCPSLPFQTTCVHAEKQKHWGQESQRSPCLPKLYLVMVLLPSHSDPNSGSHVAQPLLAYKCIFGSFFFVHC